MVMKGDYSVKRSELFEATLVSIVTRSDMNLQEYFDFIGKCHKMDEEELACVPELPEDFEGEM